MREKLKVIESIVKTHEGISDIACFNQDKIRIFDGRVSISCNKDIETPNGNFYKNVP